MAVADLRLVSLCTYTSLKGRKCVVKAASVHEVSTGIYFGGRTYANASIYSPCNLALNIILLQVGDKNMPGELLALSGIANGNKKSLDFDSP
jgi:hypothetical protein